MSAWQSSSNPLDRPLPRRTQAVATPLSAVCGTARQVRPKMKRSISSKAPVRLFLPFTVPIMVCLRGIMPGMQRPLVPCLLAYAYIP
jgi:hypothetical protein